MIADGVEAIKNHIRNLKNMAIEHHDFLTPREDLQIAPQLISISDVLDKPLKECLEAYALLQSGIVFSNLEPRLAANRLIKARNYYQSTAEKELLYESLHWLGLAFNSLGLQKYALPQYDQALKMVGNLRPEIRQEVEHSLQRDVAIAFENQNKYEQALAHFDKAQRIDCEKANEEPVLGIIRAHRIDIRANSWGFEDSVILYSGICVLQDSIVPIMSKHGHYSCKARVHQQIAELLFKFEPSLTRDYLFHIGESYRIACAHGISNRIRALDLLTDIHFREI